MTRARAHMTPVGPLLTLHATRIHDHMILSLRAGVSQVKSSQVKSSPPFHHSWQLASSGNTLDIR